MNGGKRQCIIREIHWHRGGLWMNHAGRHWLGITAVKIGMAVLTAATLAASLLCTSTYSWIARCGGVAEGGRPWLGW